MMSVMLSMFLFGMTLAIAISIPIGPVGLLCISQSISRGRWSGFVVGLGAVVVDVFFAIIAAYSLTGIMGFIKEYSLAIHIISIVTLIGVAIYFFSGRSHIIVRNHRSSFRDVENFFFSAFLNITNPFVVFTFFTVFTLSGVIDRMQGWGAPSIVAGIFVGACLWWYVLCTFAGRLDSKMNDKTFRSLNKAFGILIVALALFLIYRLLVN